MRKSWLGLWVALASSGGAVATATGCDDDGTVAAPADAGADTGVSHDGSSTSDTGTGADSTAPSEAGADTGADADASPPSSRLLLTYSPITGSQSELVAFGLQSKAVDGRMTYDDPLGTAYVGTSAPWLLEQSTDVVARLDGDRPWVVDSSWNVAMSDLTDAGYSQDYSDPQAVIVGAGTTAYVLRYTRNLIGIINTSAVVDGGVPVASIDLSGEVQTGGDGYVQPVAGVYVAAQQRVYVLLGNIDRFDVVDNGNYLLCTGSTPTIIAIDTTNGTLVDLNGSAPGHGWPLVGYNPIQGPSALAYDPSTGAQGRLLVVEAGCNTSTGDGGVSALPVKREIESVDLSTGTAQELLDLTTQQFPGGLVYIDAHHAIVEFYGAANGWDPTTTTLGAAISNAPDSFVYDGVGNLLGVSSSYGTDGGFEGYAVVSAPLDGGAVTTLGTDPFSLTGGFVGGVALWPAP